MQHHTTSPSALPKDGDSGTVATEEVNILLYPVQSHLLVQDSGVRDTLAVDLVGREEAECAKLDRLISFFARCVSDRWLWRLTLYWIVTPTN